MTVRGILRLDGWEKEVELMHQSGVHEIGIHKLLSLRVHGRDKKLNPMDHKSSIVAFCYTGQHKDGKKIFEYNR